MRAANAPAGGAEFVVAFPEAVGPVLPSRDEPVRTPEGREVLVVDDSEDVLRLAARMLEGAGYHARQARSLEEARERLAAIDRLDALVCDVRLKGAGGTAVHDAARALFPGVAVIYISGFVDDAEALRRVETAEALLRVKPFTSGALVQILERAMRGRADEAGAGIAET